MKSVRMLALALVGLMLPACGASGGGSATLQPTIAPGSPTELQTFPANGRVTITWSTTSNAGTFTVHRSTTSGGPYVPVSVPTGFTTPTTYVDGGLLNGTTFYYVVTATNRFGESQASAEAAATPGFTPRAIAVGSAASHCLAVFADGSVWGWGKNHRQQLGLDGLPGVGNDPVEVRNLSRIVSAAVGSAHSLALRNDGTVWAWGSNEFQQLGIGPTPFLLFGDPQQVPNLTGVTAVAAGQLHSLALRNDGTVWAWGSNSYGQVGDGLPSATPIDTPVQVPGLTGITAIAAGHYHSLALRSNGTVWAWGSNTIGQVGNGTTVDVPSPVMVDNLTSVTKISGGGAHSMALREDGTVWGWGGGSGGQLGTGGFPPTPVTRPVKTLNLSGVIAISAGGSHSLAVKEDGTAWGWGQNSLGELGTGAASPASAAPVAVTGVSGTSSISAAYSFSLALGADGAVSTWGTNGDGQLGIGSLSPRSRATEVFNLNSATAVAAGFNFSSALRSDGTVWAWGDDSSAQLGNGPALIAGMYLPGQVGTLTGITAIDCGYFHGLARASDGKVFAWGYNNLGQTGNGNAGVGALPSPGQVVSLTGVITAVSAGNLHSLALRGSDGAVFAWGSNSNGQLGNGPAHANPVATPVAVLNLPGAMTSVSGGGSHTLAIRGSDGSVWGWGNNNTGQLGDGTTGISSVTIPVQAQGLSNVIAVAAGEAHSMALRDDNTVWVWGSNAGDQLGLGPIGSGPQATPTMVPGLTQVVAIAAGHFHSMALRSDGTVWAWGHNNKAEVGNGEVTPVDTPVQVLGVTDATGLAAGFGHSLMVQSNGLLQAWGDNADQQLGMPFIPYSAVPVTVTR